MMTETTAFRMMKPRMIQLATLAMGRPIAVKTDTAVNTVIRGTIVDIEPLKVVRRGRSWVGLWDVAVEWTGSSGIVQRKRVTLSRLPR